MDQNENQKPRLSDEQRNPAWHDIWQILPELWLFLKSPSLPKNYQKWDRLAYYQWALLFAVEFTLTIIIALLVIEPYAQSMDIESPEIFTEDDTLFSMILLGVILAPLIEEPMFRGWLRGTKRALLFLALPTIYFGGLWLIFQISSDSNLMIITVFLWSFLIAFDGFFFVKDAFYDAAPMPQYRKYFPYIFYASAAAFGLLHIFNYDHPLSLTLIPMVTTQFLGGLVLGYVRLRFGLSAAMIMHGSSNGILIMLIYLFPA